MRDKRTQILDAIAEAFRGSGLLKLFEGVEDSTVGREVRARLKAATGNIAQGWLLDVEHARMEAVLPTELAILIREAVQQEFTVQVGSTNQVGVWRLQLFDENRAPCGFVDVHREGGLLQASLEGANLVWATMGHTAYIQHLSSAAQP